MLERSNPILPDIWFFLEISQLALHIINLNSTEKTGNAEGTLEFREQIEATKTKEKSDQLKETRNNYKKLKNAEQSYKRN